MAARTSGGGCIGVNEIGTFTVVVVVGGGPLSAALPGWEEPVSPIILPAPGVRLDPDINDNDGEPAVLIVILARSSASVGGRGRRCSIVSCSEPSLSASDPERFWAPSLPPLPPPIRESMARPTTLHTPARSLDGAPELDSVGGSSSGSSLDSLSVSEWACLSVGSRLPFFLAVAK